MNKALLLLILGILAISCKKNHSPVISGIECTPEVRNAGTTFTLKATVSDEDGDALSYLWTADEGSFLNSANTREVIWKSPVTGAGKTCTISFVVSDGENEVTREIKILLEEPELGTLEGHVNYTHFKIPIAGVTVTAGDQSTLTDQDGYFALSGIPAGECVLSAAKELFTGATLALQVPVNDTLSVAVEMTSVNLTTKLSGILTDPDAIPLENARMVVLNPDGSESKLSAITNAAGFYRLWYIPFGERTIVVTKPETGDARFLELKTIVAFQEVESQLNLTMQKVLLHGRFTDLRDNHIYPFKTIGNLTWMTENLAYLPEVSPSAKGSSQKACYYVYGYQGTDTLAAKATENYGKYGVLYNRPAALKACPTGWHLSAMDQDWNAMIIGLGSQAAKMMRTVNGWADHGGGDNLSGFSALPGGRANDAGAFAEADYNAYFWSSTKLSGMAAFIVLNQHLYSLTGSDIQGLSVRCVRDR